jgi:nucleotide-binding universal stress UspA family protein
MRTIRRILHATDFSPASRPAFVRALELARAFRAQLIALHVMSPPIIYAPDGYALPAAYDRLLADARADAQKQLDRLVARARTAGVRARGFLREGIAHDQIARAARSTHAGLLVIGTHGRTGLARLFLGSVASRVVATAPCPVLSVRARPRAAARRRSGRRGQRARPGARG